MPKRVYTVEAANTRLKAAGVRLRVEQRGSSLYLRGTLPPKPGSRKPVAHQQRISLGFPACESGINRAEAKAILIQAQLIEKTFEWEEYLEFSARNPLLVSDVLKRFEKEYRQQHLMEDRTWRKNWLKVFRSLPSHEMLTEGLMRRSILSKPDHSAARREFAQRFQVLADFAGIDCDLKSLSGSYGKRRAKGIELPTDEQIAECWHWMTTPGWRWVYGIMAAAGVRPHEAFFCEWCADGLKVLKGKTGPRLVSQLFYPEWVEQWDLKKIQLPNVNAESYYRNGYLGTCVYDAFRRARVPFNPYALRHAAAVRMTVAFEMPVTTSAALLGHTPQLHLNTYQSYIRADQVRKSAARAIAKEGRPVAPNLD